MPIRFRKTPRRRRNRRQYKLAGIAGLAGAQHIKMTTRSSSKICSMEVNYFRIPPQNPSDMGSTFVGRSFTDRRFTARRRMEKQLNCRCGIVDGQQKRHEWPTGDAFVDVFAFSPDALCCSAAATGTTSFAGTSSRAPKSLAWKTISILAGVSIRWSFFARRKKVGFYALRRGNRRVLNFPSARSGPRWSCRPAPAGVAFSPDSKVLAAAYAQKSTWSTSRRANRSSRIRAIRPPA